MSLTRSFYPNKTAESSNGRRNREWSRDIRPYIAGTGGIPAGRACRQGSEARLALLGIATNGYIGISTRDYNYGPENGDNTENLVYPAGYGINIQYRGLLWIVVESAVTVGSNVTANSETGKLSSKTESDYVLTGGIPGTLEQFQTILDGSFSVDGNNVTSLDYSSATDLADVAAATQTGIRALTTVPGYESVTVTHTNGIFSATFPEAAEVELFEEHTSGTGTDVSGLLGLGTTGMLSPPQILISGARWMTSQNSANRAAQLYLDGSVPAT